MKRSLERYHEIVAVEQVSIFLIEDHTVISFFENSAGDVEGPLLSRITSPSTLLREYPEPSLLLQGILDGIVDIVLNIISEYQKYISELQLEVLTSPSVAHTRDLHILSEELSMLRSTLMPIYGLVQTLRDHANLPREVSLPGGVISEVAKQYLADVADHVLAFTDNIDLMRHSTESMINLIFNTMSVQENEAMRQLTLVTIVFLPLTFLTGYFGMNFKSFGALDNNTIYFWAIAIPVTIAVISVILYPWVMAKLSKIRRHYEKKLAKRKHQEYMNYVLDMKGQGRHRVDPVVGYGGSELPIYSNGSANSDRAPALGRRAPAGIQRQSHQSQSVPAVAPNQAQSAGTAPRGTASYNNGTDYGLSPLVSEGDSQGSIGNTEEITTTAAGRPIIFAPAGVRAIKTELGLPMQATSGYHDPSVDFASPAYSQHYSTWSTSTQSLPINPLASTNGNSLSASGNDASNIPLVPMVSTPMSAAERYARARTRSPSPFGYNGRKQIQQVQPPHGVAVMTEANRKFDRRNQPTGGDDWARDR